MRTAFSPDMKSPPLARSQYMRQIDSAAPTRSGVSAPPASTCVISRGSGFDPNAAACAHSPW